MGRSSIGHSMGHEDIDRILSREEEILPSSGFAVSVMDVVRSEAAAPPPIPFPWKRALPGIVAGALTLGFVLIVVVIGIMQAGKTTASQSSILALPSLPPLLHGGIESAVVWTVLALLFAFASVKFSMRLLSGAA